MRDARAVLPGALLIFMALAMAHLFTGEPVLRHVTHVSMALVVLASVPRLGLREAYLLVLSAGLGWMLWIWHPDPKTAALAALDQAAFLMAFVLLISLVQEGAMTSQAVAETGLYLARQPGGRRFCGLFGGTMAAAVVFNLGTLSLLAPLIRRAAEEEPDNPLTPTRERRQLNAVLRGFAWSVVWSPTAIAPLTLLGLIEGIDRPLWIALGFAMSVTMLVLGWAEDRIAWRGHTAAALGLPPVTRTPLPRRAVRDFLSVTAAFAGLTGAFMVIFGLGVPPALMASAPLLLIGWLWAQNADAPGRLREIARHGLPATAPAAVTLGCAGFVGIAGATLVPAEALAEAVNLDSWPGWLFMLATTLGVVALSQFGFSPIMMAVFFGAVLGTLPSLPAGPTLTAVAIATGWSVSTTISPFASGVILLTRITGHSGQRLTYVWNSTFTGLAVLVLAGAYWLMTGGT